MKFERFGARSMRHGAERLYKTALGADDLNFLW